MAGCPEKMGKMLKTLISKVYQVHHICWNVDEHPCITIRGTVNGVSFYGTKVSYQSHKQH